MLLSHTFARSKTQLALINLIEPDPALPKSDRIASTFLRSFTWDELYIEVANLARGLKKLGVVVGDRVVAMTPNNAEAVMMVLAVSSIGAIWSSVAPEFGAASVLERFVQVSRKGFGSVQLRADRSSISSSRKSSSQRTSTDHLGKTSTSYLNSRK